MDRPVLFPVNDDGEVSRIRSREGPRYHVDIGIDGGDEALPEFSAQDMVYLPEELVGLAGDRFLEREGDLQHGRYDRGRNAVARYVSGKNADAVFVEDMEIEKVAPHPVHGKVPRVYGELFHDRRSVGKDRL